MEELAYRQSWPSYQNMLVSCVPLAIKSCVLNLLPLKRQRATLPIAAYRSSIMETIDSSQCVVLCGETGW